MIKKTIMNSKGIFYALLVIIIVSGVASAKVYIIENRASGETSTGGTVVFVNRTTINQTVTGTTLQNISGLGFLAAANTNYTVECTIRYRSNTTTNGLSLAVEDWGGIVNYVFGSATITGVAATTQNSGSFLATNTKVTSTAVTAVNTVYHSYLHLNILNGATPVTITPCFSAEVANQNTTIAQGSFCRVTVA
jgi:hypothetical protein